MTEATTRIDTITRTYTTAETSKCTPELHHLRCGHVVPTNSPFCSVLCIAPFWGHRRTKARTCRKCACRAWALERAPQKLLAEQLAEKAEVPEMKHLMEAVEKRRQVDGKKITEEMVRAKARQVEALKVQIRESDTGMDTLVGWYQGGRGEVLGFDGVWRFTARWPSGSG